MSGTPYLLALTTGLLGGFGHCLGMCGPLVASYTLHAGPSRWSALPHLMYNAGRITTYAFMGAVMGLTGSFVSTAGRLAGLQDFAAVLTGIFMIVTGLGITGLLKVTGFIERHNGPVLRAAKVVIETDSPLRYYPLGLLLGLLPCGLSFSIFLGAAGTGGLLPGAFFAFCFGLGTVPALFFFGFVMTYLSGRIRGWMYRASGVAVIISGIYFIVLGTVFRA